MTSNTARSDPRSARSLLKSAIEPCRRAATQALVKVVPQLSFIELPNLAGYRIAGRCIDSDVDPRAVLNPPYSIVSSTIGRHTYLADNAQITRATVGAFCSIGPNLMCGWGWHPTEGISTSPMFYSTARQNGVTLTREDKVPESKPIVIGNDVFIGMNVTIVDGASIGDGAVIGAGAVVAGDIPPYAIAVGVPARVARYRFEAAVVERLLAVRWWDFSEDRLADVERDFWDVEAFLEKHG